MSPLAQEMTHAQSQKNHWLHDGAEPTCFWISPQLVYPAGLPRFSKWEPLPDVGPPLAKRRRAPRVWWRPGMLEGQPANHVDQLRFFAWNGILIFRPRCRLTLDEQRKDWQLCIHRCATKLVLRPKSNKVLEYLCVSNFDYVHGCDGIALERSAASFEIRTILTADKYLVVN